MRRQDDGHSKPLFKFDLFVSTEWVLDVEPTYGKSSAGACFMWSCLT